MPFSETNSLHPTEMLLIRCLATCGKTGLPDKKYEKQPNSGRKRYKHTRNYIAIF